MQRTSLIAAAASLAAGLAIAGTASADHLDYYTANLQPLNGSNVTGNAVLIHDTDTNMLQVTVQMSNLEPNMAHNGHIHGLFDDMGNTADSQTPTLANDTDGDGFIEVLEGVPAYGDVITTFSSTQLSGNDPTTITAYNANNDGSLTIVQTFDLNDEGQFFSPVTGADYDGGDLFPLNFREIVFHGMTVATGEGAGTGGEVDGSGGYKALLPVTAGEIVGMPVPEPTSAALLGLGALGFLGRRRR